MHVRKRIFAFLFAALVMALLTACGKWDYSREAMKAANDAQGENVRVTFEIDQKFTSSLRGAAEDNIQPADVKNAMAMDKTIEKLLTAGYRLDIYALRADTDAAKAAAQLADEFASRLAGCKEKGYISMVKADNGYFYEAVLVYKHGGNGGASDSGEPAKTITGIKITGNPDKKTYNVGETFDQTGLDLVITYDDGSKETIELNTINSFCMDKMRGCKKSVEITYKADGKVYTYDLHDTVTVNPTIDENGYGKSALLTQAEFDGLKEVLTTKAGDLDKGFGTDETIITAVKNATNGISGTTAVRSAIIKALLELNKEGIIRYRVLQNLEKQAYIGHSYAELYEELDAITAASYDETYAGFDDVYMYITDGEDDNGDCTIECHIYFIDYLKETQD